MLAFVSLVVTLGMETYARIQKVCFWIGLVGLVVVCALLLFHSQSDFVERLQPRGVVACSAPPATRTRRPSTPRARAASRRTTSASFSFGPTLLLLPFLAFYLLWPNWGATLYGEVRGAKELRKPFCEHVLGPVGDRRLSSSSS